MIEFVGFYRELGHDGGPSLLTTIGSCPLERRAAIADYADAGHAVIAGSGWVDDVVETANTRIAGRGVLTDGRFVWPASLGYYVRRYGPEVPVGLQRVAETLVRPPEVTSTEIEQILRSLQP